MSNDYTEYSHIKVYLSEVLQELEDAEKDMTRSLLRVDPSSTEEEAKQLIGRIQGFNMALKKLERTFGAV